MAYDPNNLNIYRAPTNEVCQGHVANMANQHDALYKPVTVDPLEVPMTDTEIHNASNAVIDANANLARGIRQSESAFNATQAAHTKALRTITNRNVKVV